MRSHTGSWEFFYNGTCKFSTTIIIYASRYCCARFELRTDQRTWDAKNSKVCGAILSNSFHFWAYWHVTSSFAKTFSSQLEVGLCGESATISCLGKYIVPTRSYKYHTNPFYDHEVWKWLLWVLWRNLLPLRMNLSEKQLWLFPTNSLAARTPWVQSGKPYTFALLVNCPVACVLRAPSRATRITSK